MLYELATLDIAVGSGPTVSDGIAAWVQDPAAKGTLLGCFLSDVGHLNQVYVLRSFAGADDLHAERKRTILSANPFNSGASVTGMSLDGYAPFPFVKPLAPGAHGGVYEIRSYKVKHGGIAKTLELWEQWLPPRVAVTPLAIAMYRLEGTPGYTHIWPYADAGVRAKVRAEAVAKGIWPPKSGPSVLTEMRSTLTIPLAASPLK